MKVARVALLAAALTSACTSEAERTRAILAAHASDGEPSGVWKWKDAFEFLDVTRTPEGGWAVRSLPGEQTVRAELGASVLTLATPLAGVSRLHLCRFGDEELLVTEQARFASADARPEGARAALWRVDVVATPDERMDERMNGYLPGPDDETRWMERERGD